MTDMPADDASDTRSHLRDGDRAILAAIGHANLRVRGTLCTLAVYGATMRRDEPERARQLLDALATWPVFKAGQFLFDLMEWEDFMLDGDPPPLWPRDELAAALDEPRRLLSTPAGAVEAGAVEAAGHPELEAGWYLYNDVVLGLLDTASRGTYLMDGNRRPHRRRPHPRCRRCGWRSRGRWSRRPGAPAC